MNRFLKWAGVGVALLIGAELSTGYLNFQRGSERGLALGWLTDRVSKKLAGPDTVTGISLDGVYQPNAEPLRLVLEQSYTAEFAAFAETARAHSCHVALLYIPTVTAFPQAHAFFTGLAKSSDIPFITMLPRRTRYAAEQLYLLPADPHPSRLYNQLTARAVAGHLSNAASGECDRAAPAQRGVTGPWPANLTEMRETVPDLAFRFNSDAFGYRSTGAPASDDAQNGDRTVLLVGDSFTFGTSLSDQDTWPAFLQRAMPQATVFNAGIGGISIVRQREILERAVKDGPFHTIILQVNDTDLQGLSPAYWRHMPNPPALSEDIRRALAAIQ